MHRAGDTAAPEEVRLSREMPQGTELVRAAEVPVADVAAADAVRVDSADRALRARVTTVSPSRPFITHPVATSLLMVAVLLIGAVAYTQLPASGITAG